MHKRVSILTSVHAASDNRIVCKEARSLVEAGYQVSLVAQHGANEVVDGIAITALPKPRNRLTRMLGGSRVFMLARRQKADVYHFHDPELLPVGLLLKLLTRAKVIYDVHEDYAATIPYKHWVASPVGKPLSSMFDRIEKLVASRLDSVVAVTEDIASQFRAASVVTIHNYAMVQGVPHASHDGAGSTRLIYAGALTQGRGITELVKAMECLDSVGGIRLTLCGAFELPAYEQEIRRLRGFDKVDYTGWCTPSEIPLKVAQASVGMACLHPEPNYVPTIPTKVFEYMAAGIPVVASNFPNLKSFIEETGSGLTVDPLNPSDIARAVEYLVRHPEEAKRMGNNGRRAALERYSWESESRKLLALYENLLRGDVAAR